MKIFRHRANPIRKYILAVKYWLQGDPWPEAVQYAQVITGRWKR